MISIEQFTEMKDAMDKAQTDDTPFISTDNEEIHVFGDPNKTEFRSADYEVIFAFPNTKEWRQRCKSLGDEIGKETSDGRLFMAKRTYKNVYLSPRNVGNAITAITLLEQFMYDITDDGEIKELTYEEMKAVANTMNHELSDATYELVATVLKIPYNEQEWMLPINTFANAVKIVENNPSAVNEADLFFE